MPDTMGGKEMLKQIRARNEELGEPLVLMLSSLSDEESVLESLEMGADEFLLKPGSYYVF